MSQENVEIVRGMYRPGDPSRFFDLLHDEVELDASRYGLLPDQPPRLRGKAAVVDYFRHYWGTWDDYSLDPTEIIGAGGDHVVVVQVERGRGRGSGAPFERHWACSYTLHAAKIVRFQPFPTRNEALEAAGLSE